MGIREWTLPGPDALYLDVNEVAKLCGVDADTLRRWINAGKFPSGLKHGGKDTWSGADLAAYFHLRGRYSQNGEE